MSVQRSNRVTAFLAVARHTLSFVETPNARLFTKLLPSLYWIFGGAERRWASIKRREIADKNIAVTGSSGKSTAVHLLHEILANGAKSHKANRNNYRGVFRTILKLKTKFEYLVQEVSGGRPHGIERIIRHLDFDGAVIISVGADHWFTFANSEEKSLPLIAHEKGKLAQGVKAGGFVCLNADDAYVSKMKVPDGVCKVTFGTCEGADVRAINIRYDQDGHLIFDVQEGDKIVTFKTPYFGTLMISSVLGAIAAARQLGVRLEECANAISASEAYLYRQTTQTGQTTGHQYYVDIYKAPTWSVKVMAEDLKNYAAKRKILVLGLMAYRSAQTPNDIREILLTARKHCDLVIGCDATAMHAQKLIDEGYDGIQAALTTRGVFAILKAQPKSLVILKGRSHTKLERVLLQEERDVACQRLECSIKTRCYDCKKIDRPRTPTRAWFDW